MRHTGKFVQGEMQRPGPASNEPGGTTMKWTEENAKKTGRFTVRNASRGYLNALNHKTRAGATGAKGREKMTISFSRRKLMLVVGLTLLASGVIYAAIPVELWVGNSAHIGLWRGPATLTARTLKTPVGETTGA